MSATVTALVQVAPGAAATIVGAAVKEAGFSENATGPVSPMTDAIVQAAVTGAKGLTGDAFATAITDIGAGAFTGAKIAGAVLNDGFLANPTSTALIAVKNAMESAAASGALSTAQKAVVQTAGTFEGVGSVITPALTTPPTLVDSRVASPQ